MVGWLIKGEKPDANRVLIYSCETAFDLFKSIFMSPRMVKSVFRTVKLSRNWLRYILNSRGLCPGCLYSAPKIGLCLSLSHSNSMKIASQLGKSKFISLLWLNFSFSFT